MFKRILSRLLCTVAVTVTLGVVLQFGASGDVFAQDTSGDQAVFNRIAVFPAFLNTDIEEKTVAEIVAASQDGNTLIYTDSEQKGAGFVDITDPATPAAAGFVELDGEPTSVAVKDGFALLAVNTSKNRVDTSGLLAIVEIATKSIVAKLDLGGQPDSIAVSKDGKYAAIAIVNERDEDLGEGKLPQMPAGFLVIADLEGAPADWKIRKVGLDGIAAKFPKDAEPEYVDINDDNIAVVTLQENNHIILVDVKDGRIVKHFPAGTVDLEKIDATEEDPAHISLSESLTGIPREPNGVSWISGSLFATANEGDMDGGSRGFTIFDMDGNVKFDAGNSLDHLAVRLGHYPDGRSGNKGNEPENVKYGKFGDHGYLFVGSERASVVFVYELNAEGQPVYKQTLPAGVGPEGLLAIPSRGLFIAASEADNRKKKFRAAINIYKLESGTLKYPTIQSADHLDGTPISWGALSGLAIGASGKAYSLTDGFYQSTRIFEMMLTEDGPAIISSEITLTDKNGELAKVEADVQTADGAYAEPGFLVNSDGTVNLNGEGIAISANGGFWLVSEGAAPDAEKKPDAPITPNLLLKVAANGEIENAITLPEATQDARVGFGFEGVAEANGMAYVAFQREWEGDPKRQLRIGRYDPASGDWAFFYYPLEKRTSPNKGWVGLSDLTYLGGEEFAVIERDNQGGTDARIKAIYKFSVAGLTPHGEEEAGSFPLVEKELVRDLLPDMKAAGGFVLEKIEGLAVDTEGNAYVVNDNDGVSDSNGETQLLRLKGLFAHN